MIEYKGTQMVCFDKSKLTKREMLIVNPNLDGITTKEDDAHIYVYDLEFKHPKFMSKMVDLLYRTIRR